MQLSDTFGIDRLRKGWKDLRWMVRQRYFSSFSFAHINKTGGSSIEKALGLSFEHRTALEIKACIGDRRWAQRYSFAFVRNPWDKVVSHYHYRVSRQHRGLDGDPIDFVTWVKLAYGQNDPRYYDQPKMFMPQMDWICDENGEVLIDFIGRFERLSEDFSMVCRQLGVSVELPHLKKSEHANYREYYTDVTREIVRQWFARDVEVFGYEF